MTRDNSSPAWPIPQPLAPTDPFFVRPKTLRPLESHDENVVAIGANLGDRGRCRQHPPYVQQLSECEREILDVIVSLGGIAGASKIANELECNVQMLRRKELHRLHCARLIEPVHGRGYRVTDLGKAAL